MYLHAMITVKILYVVEKIYFDRLLPTSKDSNFFYLSFQGDTAGFPGTKAGITAGQVGSEKTKEVSKDDSSHANNLKRINLHSKCRLPAGGLRVTKAKHIPAKKLKFS